MNRRFVELFAKGRNLIGQHVQFLPNLVTPGAQPMEIVGVAGDLREDAWKRKGARNPRRHIGQELRSF